MPKKVINISEKLSRRNFLLMNKAGQLGRYGVLGPVERSEKKVKGLKPKGT